jgi:hypothetical protein
MNHRTVTGKLSYVHDRHGETGREWFAITENPGHQITVRARCEMDDEAILRDVTYTLDQNWRPQDAFNRLTVEDRFRGSSWFRFADDKVECEAMLADLGRFHQSVPVTHRPPVFAPHPVICDGFQFAGFDQSNPERTQVLYGCANSSPQPDGGSGPMIGIVDKALEYVGVEKVSVDAGTFHCNHFRILPMRTAEQSDWPPLDVWTMDDLNILVRLRWNLLESDYVLTELSGL